MGFGNDIVEIWHMKNRGVWYNFGQKAKEGKEGKAMSEIRMKYDEEFKKNAVKLSYASPKSVKQVAENLGISENLLYAWRKKYTADGDKSRQATQEEEIKTLRLEVAELRIERDMLKKATAYFANLHK
jgi:transposase